MKEVIRHLQALAVVWLTMAGAGLAGAGSAGAEAPAVHALTGVRIIVAPGQEIPSGTVVLRDGVIEAVGAGIEPPADARVWEDEELTVYAGLVDPYTTARWPEPDDDDAPQGGHDNAIVTPERDITPWAHDESRAKKLREAGYTTALVAPEQGLFRGRGAVINLGEGSLGANLLQRDPGQFVTLSAASDEGYPGSLMGSIALFRQTLLDSRWYAAAHDAWQRNHAQSRPVFNTALDALAPVARGETLVTFRAEDLHDVLRIAGLVEEFGLDARVVATGYEYQRLDQVIAEQLPLVLPLAFPEAPGVGEDDDLSVTLEDLRHWDLAPDNPRQLLDAGATVAFTTFGLGEAKDIHGKLATAIERGLSPAAALAGVTTTPAQMLGLGDQLGTVEVGKIANLVVVEGDLFVAKPKIREVWIDGRRLEIKETKPPEIDPAGTWSLTLDTGGGKMQVTVILTGSVDDLSGAITSQAGELPLLSAEVSGKSVDFAIDSTSMGMPGTITFQMSVSGETSSGSGTSPRGSFTFTGRRTEKPAAEPEPKALREGHDDHQGHHHEPHVTLSSNALISGAVESQEVTR